MLVDYFLLRKEWRLVFPWSNPYTDFQTKRRKIFFYRVVVEIDTEIASIIRSPLNPIFD